MIQFNFPSMQPVPVRALQPFSPRDVANGPMPPPSHKKSSSFTRRIYEHGGPFKDTSMDAATRKRQINCTHFEKQFGSCNDLISEWDVLVKDVNAIAVEIFSSQLLMAKEISQFYASVTVQLAFRTYIARRSLCRLKSERLVKTFILFKRLKGPLGKLSFYILSTFYTEGAFFPNNATIEFIRRKVLNSQQGQNDNSRLTITMARKNVRATAIRNSPLRISRPNIGELTKTAQPDSPTTPVFSPSHLPTFFQGAYRPKSIWEVYKLIRDLTYIAKLHPEVLDDSTPPSASVLMTLYTNKRMSSRRLRIPHTNSSGNMSVGTDSSKGMAPLPPPSTTPRGKGAKKVQKQTPPSKNKPAQVQAPKGGKAKTTSPTANPLTKTASMKGAAMADLEELTDETDDDAQSTGTNSSRDSSIILRMPTDDASEGTKKKCRDSKKLSEKEKDKASKPAELKRENSITKKPLTKTLSGKSNVSPSAGNSKPSPKSSTRSASSSPKSTQNNSNQNSSSSLQAPPMLGDKSSRQSSLKGKGGSARSLADEGPAPALSKSQGNSTRSIDSDKDGAKDKPGPPLSVRSNSRIGRLQSRANSSSSIQESNEECEEESKTSSDNVLLRTSLTGSPMKDLLDASMPVAEAQSVLKEEESLPPLSADSLDPQETEQERQDVKAVLDRLVDNVVMHHQEVEPIEISMPSTLNAMAGSEAESMVGTVVAQTLQSLVDKAILSTLLSPNVGKCAESSDEKSESLRGVGTMTIDVVSSVLENSIDSLVFKITGSPPKPKLRLDTSF
eukprot:gene32930-39826_t